MVSEAQKINQEQDLSGIKVGLKDEIFQAKFPVLAGVDAFSTYCYLLVGAEHRDEDTWGYHLLEASEQGLNPDYSIALCRQRIKSWTQSGMARKTLPRRCLSYFVPRGRIRKLLTQKGILCDKATRKIRREDEQSQEEGVQ